MLRVAEVIVLLVATALAQEPNPAAPAQPTVTLEGRVVDLRGEPMPAAKVWVVTWNEPDVVLARGTCDGDGCFRIGHVKPQELMLVRATAAGKNVAWVSAHRALRLRLHDAATVRGVLRDAKGAPVAQAIVRAADLACDLESADCFATTGEDGSFRIMHVPLGPVHIAAVVPGEGQYLATVCVAGDVEVELARAPEPTTSLRIAITDLSPDAAALTTVSLLPYGGYSRLPPPWDRPRLQADGTCSLRDLPDTDYAVQLVCAGLAFAPATAALKAGAGPHEIRFTASSIDSIAQRCPARLCDGDGKPIGGAKMVLRAANSSRVAEATSNSDGELVFASHLAMGADAVVESRDDRWVLDPNQSGNRGLQRHELVLHVCKVEPRTTLELRAVRACSVAGRVLMPDRSPAAFVDVMLEAESSNQRRRWEAFEWATTDRNGSFRFGPVHHLAEPVRVLVEDSAGCGASEPFGLAKAGDEVARLELKLAPPARIEGVVLDDKQRPAAGVRVWLQDWDFAANRQKSGSFVEVITDRLGRYRFLGVPPGGAWLQWQVGTEPSPKQKRAVEPFEVEAGKTYTHDLQVPAK